jgi:SSS family solute:Na+ symporter
MLLVLGWVFVPLYLQHNVYTMPEFLQKRFNSRRLQLTLTIMSLLLYIFTKISVTLYAGGVVFRLLLGWNLFVSAGVLILATGAYTLLGGLRAVVYTEIFQTGTLLLGGLTLVAVGLHRVGGYSGLRNTLPDSYFHLFRPPTDPDYPWPGMVFGLQLTSLWYWCTDQVIVQRVLCAKTAAAARSGTIAAGFLKLLPMFMMVWPGLIAQALYPDDILRHGTDAAYPILIVRTLPSGAAGFMLAAMLAALMSSLASVFNSSSTLFAMDIWRTHRPNASDAELVRVGRVVIVVMCIIGLSWLPIIQHGTDQLFVYIQSVSSYLSPPVAVVFVAAVGWQSTSERAVFWTLLFGLSLGLARLLGEFAGHADASVFFQLNFLYFALVSATCCVLLLGILSWWDGRRNGSAIVGAPVGLQDLGKAPEESDNAELLGDVIDDDENDDVTSVRDVWATVKSHPGQGAASLVLVVVILGLYAGFA